MNKLKGKTIFADSAEEGIVALVMLEINQALTEADKDFINKKELIKNIDKIKDVWSIKLINKIKNLIEK